MFLRLKVIQLWNYHPDDQGDSHDASDTPGSSHQS